MVGAKYGARRQNRWHAEKNMRDCFGQLHNEFPPFVGMTMI